jgi:hypothetical protein
MPSLSSCTSHLTSPPPCSAEEEATCIKAVRAFLPHRTTILFTQKSNGAAAAGTFPPPHAVARRRLTSPSRRESLTLRHTPAAHRLYLLSGAGSGRVIAATGGAGGALEPTRYEHHAHTVFRSFFTSHASLSFETYIPPPSPPFPSPFSPLSFVMLLQQLEQQVQSVHMAHCLRAHATITCTCTGHGATHSVSRPHHASCAASQSLAIRSRTPGCRMSR